MCVCVFSSVWEPCWSWCLSAGPTTPPHASPSYESRRPWPKWWNHRTSKCDILPLCTQHSPIKSLNSPVCPNVMMQNMSPLFRRRGGEMGGGGDPVTGLGHWASTLMNLYNHNGQTLLQRCFLTKGNFIGWLSRLFPPWPEEFLVVGSNVLRFDAFCESRNMTWCEEGEGHASAHMLMDKVILCRNLRATLQTKTLPSQSSPPANHVQFFPVNVLCQFVFPLFRTVFSCHIEI